MFRMPKEDLVRAQILMGGKPNAIHAARREVDEVEILPQSGWLSSLCFYANISAKERNKIYSYVAFTSLFIVLVAILSKTYLVFAIIFPSLFAFLRLSKRAYKRAENFEKDYPAFLLSLASSVRTGLDPLSALIESEKLFEPDSEIRKELFKFKINIDKGKPEFEAVQEFAASIKHPDIQLFRTGYILARREGSSLAECLQRLAKVTRQRQSFRRKVRSAVAMQRLSAFGIGGCAILISAIQSLGNPQIITDALAHPLGQRLLITGGTLILLGLFWMVRMTKSNI